MDIQIRVRKQVLTCRQNIIAGSVNFVKAHFMFDDEWEGTEKHVIFSNGDAPDKEIILNENTLECIVPWEAIEAEGDLYISVVGLLDGEVRISTKLMDNPITVYPHGQMGGSDPLPPTPTVWDDIKDALPVDWNENDPESLNYIKNRTHWKEEIPRDYTVLPNIEPDPITGFIEYGKKIGLEIGKEYTLEAHLLDGTTRIIQAVATEYPGDDVGIAGITCIIVENICNIIDGVVFDITTEPPITAGDNCYYQYLDSVVDSVEKGIIKDIPNVETIIHKIPNEYLPKQKPKKGSITSSMIADGAITTKHLGYKVVTTEKIEDEAITSGKIKNGAVTVSKTYDIKNLFSSEILYGDAVENITIASFLEGQRYACIEANLTFTADNPTINLSYSKYYPGSGFVYYPLYSVQLSKPAYISVPIWIRFTWENEKAIWEISVDGNSTFVIGQRFPTSFYIKTSDEITFYGNVKLDQLKSP